MGDHAEGRADDRVKRRVRVRAASADPAAARRADLLRPRARLAGVAPDVAQARSQDPTGSSLPADEDPDRPSPPIQPGGSEIGLRSARDAPGDEPGLRLSGQTARFIATWRK